MESPPTTLRWFQLLDRPLGRHELNLERDDVLAEDNPTPSTPRSRIESPSFGWFGGRLNVPAFFENIHG